MKLKRKNNRYISLLADIGKRRLITCIFMLFLFVWLSKAVLDKKTIKFDESLLLLLHNHTNNNIALELSKIFYYAGDAKYSAIVVILSLGILFWKGYWQEAKILAIASLGVLVIVDRGLKPFFDISRPGESLVSKVGKSFPSGHATGNFVLYFYLAYLLAERFPKLTIYIYGVITAFLILIGLSSMYLRVHWPTDIIAGYASGYVWLTICLGMLKISTNKYKKYN